MFSWTIFMFFQPLPHNEALEASSFGFTATFEMAIFIFPLNHIIYEFFMLRRNDLLYDLLVEIYVLFLWFYMLQRKQMILFYKNSGVQPQRLFQNSTGRGVFSSWLMPIAVWGLFAPMPLVTGMRKQKI